jgi:hypothetical protein
MKKKDLITLIISVAILLVAGYLAYTQLVPQKGGAASKDVKVEVVGPIQPDFDDTAMNALNDPTKVRDFAVDLDLTTGLGNQAIFGL